MSHFIIVMMPMLSYGDVLPQVGCDETHPLLAALFTLARVSEGSIRRMAKNCGHSSYLILHLLPMYFPSLCGDPFGCLPCLFQVPLHDLSAWLRHAASNYSARRSAKATLLM